MNYIILNGKKSTTINGLLIRSLPPIAKPPVRTQIDEIDGKDGDLVTVLGYSAYDKIIEIGLYGDYDINEIISFFDSSGTVIFSNEDDKYYNYQIINQIDFEQLIRFKTATVTMHMQPFKYSAVEGTENIQVGEEKTVKIRNSGNIGARPTLTIYGTGNIDLSLNGVLIFDILLGDEEYITIDTAKMEAYKENNLKNRLVTGNYNEFVLRPGKNTIGILGAVERIEIENFSRWL